METLLSVCLGVGLAAACGFRIFVPFLLMNVAARAGYLALSGGFDWVGSTAALIVFAVATVVEVLAYYVPWLDHALDTMAAPLAVVAGVVITASAVGDINPLLKWSLAIIAGGGAAAAVQSVTTLARGASTATTLGAGNFVVSTLELVGSVLMSVVAIALPFLAAVLFATLVLFAARKLLLRRPVAPTPAPLAG